MTEIVSNTAHLPDGIDIFYTDSGAPSDSTDYTTLVILHGSAFTGPSFKKLHGYAHALNLRTVVWNRRDYPGSTKYTDAELDDLKNGRQEFIDRLAVQLGQFLEQFIEEEHIPKISANRKSGGLAIMGWSMGIASVIPLFSSKELVHHSLLEPYVKDLIIYDPPYLALGYSLPTDANTTMIPDHWANPENRPLEELYQNFMVWVSSYYDQPANPHSINELNFVNRKRYATIDAIGPEEMKKQYDEAAAVRSEPSMYAPLMSQTLSTLSNRVLFDEKCTQTVFPNVPVIYIASSKTHWHSYWAGLETKRIYEKRRAIGENVRPIVFVSIAEGNHFVHWDMPGLFMETVAREIHGATPVGIRAKL